MTTRKTKVSREKRETLMTTRTRAVRKARRMERRIKREDTRRTITVLCATLNKKTHTVSAL